MSVNVQLPEWDEEFELQQAEDFASMVNSAVKGELDTCGMGDVPEGKYSGTILDAGVQTRTNRKTGDIEPPSFFVKVRCPQYTTTVFKSTTFARGILQIGMSLLGQTDKALTPGKNPETMTLQDRVDYYANLGKALVGKKAEWTVRIIESERGKFPNFSFAPAM